MEPNNTATSKGKERMRDVEADSGLAAEASGGSEHGAEDIHQDGTSHERTSSRSPTWTWT